MKITKSYLKQLIVEELKAEEMGDQMVEEQPAPKTYLELYKKMGQAISNGAGEQELEALVQQMIALHPDSAERIRRRAATQRQLVKPVK